MDFGSACMENRTVYSYVQSHYYRSPEVLLGYQYTTAIDMWSFGCVVEELFLGLPLFPGASEFDLLRRMTEILGQQPPDYILKDAKDTGDVYGPLRQPYFAKKWETEAVVVQTLGVILLYVVFAQLAMAEAMPWPYFVATSVVVSAGLVLNFLNYFEKLNPAPWYFWEDFITICGVSALPQIMWSTFVAYVPDTILPGVVACAAAVAAVVMMVVLAGLSDFELLPLRFSDPNRQTPGERCEVHSVSIWMDSDSSFHVDACFTNVDKLPEPGQY